MLNHKDSPYIRAIGFLFLRYCCNPRSRWEWFPYYIQDTEQFSPSPTDKFSKDKTITMGEYVRDLLLSQFYFETIFPRIPKPVEIDIEKKMRELGVSTNARGNGGQCGPSRGGRGGDDERSRPTSVKAGLSVGNGNKGPHKYHHDDSDSGRGGGRDRYRDDRYPRANRSGDRYDRFYHHSGRKRSRERSRERIREGDTAINTINTDTHHHGEGRGTSDVFL